MHRSRHLTRSRAALAALLGATLLAAPALASSDDSPKQPPATGEQPAPPPSKGGGKNRDRGLLGGPSVDPLAAEGRQGFGREGRPGAAGARPEGRAMAMLVDAVKKTEPTPEQSAAIQLYLEEVREKARRFSDEHGEEMRQLMRVRGELVRAGEPTDEVDAELAVLRAKVVNPREIVEKVTSLLDPERQEKLGDFIEAARRAAMEDARRRRGGEAPGMKDGAATGADPMREGPRRPRGDAPRRRGQDAPPLDLGDGPGDGAGAGAGKGAPKDPANRPAPPPPPPPPTAGG